MNGAAWRVGLGCLMVALLCACDRTTSGTAADTSAVADSRTTTATTSTTTRNAGPDTSLPDMPLPAYGVVPTTRRPLAAGETTCAPPAGPTVDVRGSAAGSPTAVVTIPDGFSPTGATGDAALALSGPSDMTATVTITPTTLDPAAAFDEYSNEQTRDFEITSVSVLPGELCDYSGQEQMGSLAKRPGAAIEYATRLVHVWTDAGAFLVAVRLQGPSGVAGFDAARSAVLADFGIRMP